MLGIGFRHRQPHVRRSQAVAVATLLALWSPALVASGAIITSTSGVYDEQSVQLNTVDQTATSPTAGTVNLVSLAQFKTDVAAAFNNNTGGVINFDDQALPLSSQTAINASYGTSQLQTLILTGSGYQVDMSAAGAIGAAPISGSVYLRSNNSSGVQSFSFSAPLSEVGFTVLARNAARTITATVTYDDTSTGTIGPFSIAANTGSGDTSSPDTFFGFSAPTGRTISSLSISAGANNYFVVDDIGFIAVPAPSTLILLTGLVPIGWFLWRLRRRPG